MCNLKWKITALCTKVDFLDLTILIDSSGNLWTRTFQKPMCLFLYIPPHSAHPPGLMKSLVFGLLQSYFLQNTFLEDFYKMIRLLFHRLLARGHALEDLKILFSDAIDKITEINDPMYSYLRHLDNESSKSTPDSRIFFHIPYHPRDISRKRIREIYHDTCESDPTCAGSFKSMPNDETGDHMTIDKLTVAYHRPKNLRDLLSPSVLVESESCFVSKYVST